MIIIPLCVVPFEATTKPPPREAKKEATLIPSFCPEHTSPYCHDDYGLSQGHDYVTIALATLIALPIDFNYYAFEQLPFSSM